MNSESLIPKRLLFRISVPCYWYESPGKGIVSLDEQFRLPPLAELEGGKAWADVRVAWNHTGLMLSLRVEEKQQSLWCRANRPEDSDGLHVWIDTRDVHSVHRAGRYCHRFLFAPAGGGADTKQPMALWLPIHRAGEHPATIPPGAIQVRSKVRSGGYRLDAFLSARALTGFDPDEHPRMGFTYAVIDRELGEQTFAAGQPMPYQEDPSLWATLELVRR